MDDPEITHENKDVQYGPDDCTHLHKLMADPLDNDKKIKSFLKMKPNVNLQENVYGRTPLMTGAAVVGEDGEPELDREIILTILNDTDLKLLDRFGNNLLHIFMKYGVSNYIDKVLEHPDIDITTKNGEGEVALNHVHNDKLMDKILESYRRNNLTSNWPRPDNKSELLTNLEDYVSDPRKMPGKLRVLEKLCTSETGYNIPSDMSAVITLALSNTSKCEGIKSLLGRLLSFGSGSIISDHLMETLKLGDESIFQTVTSHCNSEDVKKLIITSDVILCCLSNKKNGDRFYKLLKDFLHYDLDQLINIKDSLGCNLAHYMCKHEKTELVQELLTIHPDIASKLFKSLDNCKYYPLASDVRSPTSKFLSVFKEYFIKPPKGFENIRLATPSTDLLHYSIEKKNSKLANALLDVGFGFETDSNERSALHKAVLSFKTCKLVDRIISAYCDQNGQESKSSLVNHTDNFGFNCLDYVTLHSEKKDIFEDLLLRHGAVNCVSPEKLIHYLVGEQDRSQENIEHILKLLEIPYPSSINQSSVREIKKMLQKADQISAEADTKEDTPITLNILIAHKPDTIFNQQLAVENSDKTRNVLCHSLPLDRISPDTTGQIAKLVNRRLLVVGKSESETSSMKVVLGGMLDIPPELISTAVEMDRIPGNLLNVANVEDDGTPSGNLLCTDEEVIKITDENKAEVDFLSGFGYFFSGKNFFVRSLYNNSFESITAEEQNMFLASLGVQDAYYDDKGARTYRKRLVSKFDMEAVPASDAIVMKVLYKKKYNISRFFIPLLGSRLIQKYSLIPGDSEGLLLISPDVHVTFRVGQEGGEDILFAEVAGTVLDPKRENILMSYLLGLLKKIADELSGEGIEVKLQRKGAVLTALNTGKDTEIENGNLIEIEDFEVPNAGEKLTGSSLLLTVDIQKLERAVVRASKNSPMDRYYQAMSQECALFTDKADVCGKHRHIDSELIYRIIFSRKDYTIRQFVRDGQWDENGREIICNALDLPVAETYSKGENCWRMNKADVIVLGLGLLLTAAILIALEVADIDLETYGIAGLTSLPFIIALINRVRMSWSHNPNYEKLPSIFPG